MLVTKIVINSFASILAFARLFVLDINFAFSTIMKNIKVSRNSYKHIPIFYGQNHLSQIKKSKIFIRYFSIKNHICSFKKNYLDLKYPKSFVT